jgi:threonine/homoserine/homoserine lactone efflux protein
MTLLGIPLAFLWTALLIELTPGPNMSYLAVLSLAEGKRAGIAAVAGVATGLLIVGVIAALGLAAVISESALLFNLLRWCGVLYLVWLAYNIWIDGDGDELRNGAKNGGWLHWFNRGLITNLLNPKAAAFYIAVLPPFINPAENVLRQTLAMSVAYVTVATAVHASIVSLAGTLRPRLESSDNMPVLRRFFSVAVLGIALWLAWSTRMVSGG